MRVLMLTPTVDLADRLNTGFAHGWVKALARHVEHVDVLCRVAGLMDLPSNVTVTGLDNELNTSRLKLLLAFHQAIGRRIRDVDVVFAHFIPPYVLAAAPSAKLHGVPLIHWNANKITHMQMRLAHLLANRIVTATPDSYPFSGPKVTVIGHGVDFDLFAPAKRSLETGRIVVTVGRLTPSKNLELQVEAAALLLKKPGFEDVIFKAVGDEPWWTDGYCAKLEAYISKLGLAGRFQLSGGRPYAEMASSYQEATMMVSTSKSGSLDKVVLEAIGCGLPALVTGRVFEPLLGEDRDLLFAKDDDPQDLAKRLAQVLSMDPAERRALGLRLRQLAIENHSLEHLMTNLVAVFHEEINRRRRYNAAS